MNNREPLILVVNPEIDTDLIIQLRQMWASLRGLGFEIEWINGTAFGLGTIKRPVIMVSDCIDCLDDSRILHLIHVENLHQVECISGEHKVYMFKECDELRDLLIYLYDYGLRQFLKEMGD